MKSRFKKIEPYLYLLPCFIGFSIFVFFPFIKTIFLSFNITNANGEAVEYVGLENYKEIINKNT